ncbi:MAG: hypothetical protein WKF65_09765 [Gaiellaceae bacterium]
MRLALFLTVLVVGLASPALAHFDTGSYTHKEPCPGTTSNRIDPLNFIFQDWGTWQRAVASIETHAGWGNTSGSNQTFVDHGNCYNTTAHRADGTGSRNHIRLHPIHYDTTLGYTTVGDAHHEDFVITCGHAVDANGDRGSGFDQGRNNLFFALDGLPGHSGYYSWWGNTQNFQQCDGGYAGSDGNVVFMSQHQISD